PRHIFIYCDFGKLALFLTGHFIRSQLEYSIVYPKRVGRDKRALDSSEKFVHYSVAFGGQDLTFNLTVNNYLLASNYVLEGRSGCQNMTLKQNSYGENSCHLIGRVTNSSFQGTAAVSICKGLVRIFRFIQGLIPLFSCSLWQNNGERYQFFVIRRNDLLKTEREREVWEREHQHPEGLHRVMPRSVSRERWVETMVVADSKLIDYHGITNVESYIFTIMNMVAGVFHDASIGNAIHIVLVRLVLLQEDEKGLKIVHHADTTLNNFCTWQKSVNPQSDTHPAHHDVAVLITRKDICAGMNQPCETLGLSHLSGMCQPHRSCNINEDSGLPVAFTVAHELGHSFGIPHDGQGNDCEPQSRRPFIMSRQLQYDASPLTWSPCSREAITRFLDRGWGSCLDDRPSKKDLTMPLEAPGVRYTINHQCQLQYGPNATFCPENICQVLWCSVNDSCRSKLDSPADGTRCGPDKWCISGECVIVGKLPETVNGGWGEWSAWSHCSRTCGAGVHSAQRECNRPKPEFGGKYCMGERKRYRVCNTKRCIQERPTFREMQCSEFDTVLYHNKLYQWIPVTSTGNPCELHCRPVDEDFSEKMLDAVTDGTPCFTNSSSRSLCINGVCKEVGCDYGIDSNAVEDRCGVCLGDGSACQTVRKHFEEGEGFGYVDVALIPEGARDIVVQEVEEAGNFLALRGQDPEKYYLNGRFIIQWKGEYEAGGATFYYERNGDLENLTSPGPTREPVMIQLLVQGKNPGIKYEYTIRKSRKRGNEILEPEYRWKHGAWTDCSTTCGAGVQSQPARCFEVDVGVVEESLCDPKTRPEDRQRRCKKMDCPARWWVGGWQPCSAPCGPSGMKKRTVLCVRTVGVEERVLHPSDCRHLLKPKPAVPCNRDVPCGSEWAVGPWSQCSVSCGGGVKSRTVTCRTAPTHECETSSKPRSRSLCALQGCSSGKKKILPSPSNRNRVHKDPKGSTEPSYRTPTRAAESIATTTVSMSANVDPSISNTEGNFSFFVVQNTSKDDDGTPGIYLVTAENERRTPNFLFPSKRTRHSFSHDFVTEASNTSGERGLWGLRGTTEVPPRLSTVPQHTVIPEDKTSPSPASTSTGNWMETTTRPTIWSTMNEHFILSDTTGSPGTTHTTSEESRGSARSLSPSEFPPGTSTITPSGPSSSTDSSDANLDAVAPVRTNISWVCSATCGVGAMWRTVTCSSLREAHCAGIHRPEPARRCHLRPCATWHSGSWSKCPEGCLGGTRQRDVHCIDTQSKRQLRPYHCQALAYRPPSSELCSLQPCQEWQVSPWGKCSRKCGEGVRERLVYCLEPNHCDPTWRPNSSEPCNRHPCSKWQAEAWEECSVTCGKGVQYRVVKCVDHELGIVENGECKKGTRPHSIQRCSLQDCRKNVASRCNKDRMSSRFCEKLMLLGRCSLRSIQKQCCVTHRNTQRTTQTQFLTC
uniref:ADAM metallopeptidase with thrombospondin type 1 motif, 12 n=1 Tax=Scleropages formosus TaxID=113540 RepID=A0A8C9SCL0_SCLFO